jgi:hypothetical protein
MIKILIFAMTLMSTAAYARPVTIAVIDTGFGYYNAGHEAKLCQYGHRDFSTIQKFTAAYKTKDLVPEDFNGHGSNIVGIIDGYLKKTNIDYCIVIIKFYSSSQSGDQNEEGTIKAIKYATNIRADYINYSGGGPDLSTDEQMAVREFLNQGGVFVAAAGNENRNLDLPQYAYYPALDDSRVISVGNLGRDGKRYPSSNYGSVVTEWEIGEDVTVYNIARTGTSQATAVATGKLVAKRFKVR